MFNFFQFGKNSLASSSIKALPVDPLTLNPSGAFATHRLVGIQSIYILKARRIVAADVVDIYDFQLGTSNYKLTAVGSWIDGSAETFYLETLYDQSGNTRNFIQVTEVDQPQLLLNSRNGYPSFQFDGSTDRLRNSATADDFIDNNLGVLIVNMKPTGATPPVGQPYLGDVALGDADGWINISRANLSGTDRIWVNNFNSGETFVEVTYSVNAWIVITWRHVGGNLYAYKNGALVGSITSGNTGAMAAPMISGDGDFSTEYYNGEINQYYLFDADLTPTQIKNLSTYIILT